MSTRRDNIVETLHGVKVADPYRWLEDGASPEVVAWTDAQNAQTRRVLDAIPGRAELEARLWSLHEIGSLGAPVPRPTRRGRDRGWRYFYTRRAGKQNQAVLYVRDGLSSAVAGGRAGVGTDTAAGTDAVASTGTAAGTDIDRVLVDVNVLASDGTRALDWWFPSEDGRLLAYGVSADGSEESVLRIRDVASGHDLPDEIVRTRACSLAWLPDGSGFYYTRYPAVGTVPAGEETYHRRVFLHRLGASPDTDALVFGAGRDLKDWPSVGLSPDGRFLGIEVSQGWSKSELFVLDRAASAAGSLLPVAVGVEAIFDLSEITNNALFIRTNDGAPRYRVFRVPLPRPSLGSPASGRRASMPAARIPDLARSSWREIIPESPWALQQVVLVGKTLVALYLEDAISRVRLSDTDGRFARDVALPTLGSVGGIYGHPEGREFFLPFTSFLSPTTILRQDLSDDGHPRPSVPPRGGVRQSQSHSKSPSPPSPPSVWQQIPSPVPPDSFVVTQDRFKSKDGTEIPIFLVHRRDLVRDGNTPTLLYGYGGFNVNITPGWVPAVVPFLEKGGVYAVAVLRGGGEYGEDWHQAGMLGRKQNVFDDFVAAAENLIASKITSPAHLAIMGRSNGGLLVGAALTQRPDLFRAVVCGVPLLDMLRYHRFRIAKLWIPEYGSADDANAFQWLAAYSPYHNVKEGVAYPAVLFVTAASDTRVDPLHARKMTARVQAATKSGRPVLLRLETQAGHGAGKPLGKVIAQLVDEWSFLAGEIGLR